ncbi:MAG TPA: fructose-bisphosphate aldolase [Firmicutes bacterium]|nr:fructose-bisphosphate aldolase [Candidatus Fermentithermobacillaceae bacterium]
MESGVDEMTSLRMRRIFAEDGRALVVAIDHALSMGHLPGLEDPERIIGIAASERADAVMTTAGVVKRCAGRLGKTGLIVRADFGGTYLASQPPAPDLAVSIEEALTIGADALAVMLYPGAPRDLEERSFRNLSLLVREGMKWGVPVLAEVVPYGSFDLQRTSPEDIVSCVRMAAEAGADFIKTFYAGGPESFSKVAEAARVPVLILGGPKVSGELGLLKMVRDALDAGASGVAFGRNIWQHKDPAGVVRALRQVIHEGVSPEEAAERLGLGCGA